MSREFWEDFYGGDRARWSGKPNAALVEEVGDLPPGTALDLGCGQGGDAIWLASQGWTVTGADISQTALDAAARAADSAGVTVSWERHDLAESMPAGPFELVTTSFLHSPEEHHPWGAILRAAATTVAPGGTLLVVGHAPSPEHHHAEDLPTADEVVAELALPEDGWEPTVCELRERQHAFRGEAPKTRVDSVVRFRRR